MTVAMVSCPTACGTWGPCPFRLALSASLPGDFRPVCFARGCRAHPHTGAAIGTPEWPFALSSHLACRVKWGASENKLGSSRSPSSHVFVTHVPPVVAHHGGWLQTLSINRQPHRQDGGCNQKWKDGWTRGRQIVVHVSIYFMGNQNLLDNNRHRPLSHHYNIMYKGGWGAKIVEREDGQRGACTVCVVTEANPKYEQVCGGTYHHPTSLQPAGPPGRLQRHSP